MLEFVHLTGTLTSKTTTNQNRVVTHGLGQVPDIVFIIPRTAGRVMALVARAAATFTMICSSHTNATFDFLAIRFNARQWIR